MKLEARVGRESRVGRRIDDMMTCSACGAEYASADESCGKRFDVLLALDHSRSDPWGRRHALAFSPFALQHPDRFSRSVMERAWLLLWSIYVEGTSADHVISALRCYAKHLPDWGTPKLPDGTTGLRFAVTIADLGEFEAETYAERLDDWCRAAIDGWRALSTG